MNAEHSRLTNVSQEPERTCGESHGRINVLPSQDLIYSVLLRATSQLNVPQRLCVADDSHRLTLVYKQDVSEYNVSGTLWAATRHEVAGLLRKKHRAQRWTELTNTVLFIIRVKLAEPDKRWEDSSPYILLNQHGRSS